MLHGFTTQYSDIDLTIYGKTENAKVRQTNAELYLDTSSG